RYELHQAMGKVYTELNNYPKSFQHFYEALSIRQSEFPNKYYSNIGIDRSITRIYLKTEQFNLAIKHCKKLLEFKDSIRPDNGTKFALLNQFIGWLCYKNEQYELAFQYCTIALNIYNNQVDTHELDCITVLNYLGNIALKLHQYGKAWNYCTTSMTRLEMVNQGVKYKLIANHYELFGNISFNCNDKILGYNCYRRALEILSTIKPVPHNDIKRVRQSLNRSNYSLLHIFNTPAPIV
ncbi:unnamed protein product, partial [Didymodactylos carnosus]